MQNTLQTRIMKRFMTKGQMSRFFIEYDTATSSAGGNRCRTNNLESAITEDDLEFLKYYTENSEMSLKEMSEELGTDNTSLTHKAGVIAVKWAFQNSEKVFGN